MRGHHARRQRARPASHACACAKQDKLPVAGEPFIKPWMVPLADDDYELDIGRARAVLGWEPRNRLTTTLQAMIERLRADPVRWYRENKLDAPSWLAYTNAAAPEAARPDDCG